MGCPRIALAGRHHQVGMYPFASISAADSDAWAPQLLCDVILIK